MNRFAASALVAATVLASAAAGTGAWLLARNSGPTQPLISAYSDGELTRVGPYLYCNVLDLNACQLAETQGELTVNSRNTVQLSVDPKIARAPWRLLRVYQDPADTTTTTVFRPGSTQAVTIPTVDPQRGQLSGLVVQLLTLVADPAGELYDVPHAEWSVRMRWG